MINSMLHELEILYRSFHSHFNNLVANDDDVAEVSHQNRNYTQKFLQPLKRDTSLARPMLCFRT